MTGEEKTTLETSEKDGENKTTLETSEEEFEWVDVKSIKKKTRKVDLEVKSFGVPGISQEIVQKMRVYLHSFRV